MKAISRCDPSLAGAWCTPLNLTSCNADACLVKGEIAYKWDHIIVKGLRLLGVSSVLCEQGKESGGGGGMQLGRGSVWGLSFLALRATRELKIGKKQRPGVPNWVQQWVGPARTDSGCVQTTLECLGRKLVFQKNQISKRYISCNMTKTGEPYVLY